jgi:hypothetical protein
MTAIPDEAKEEIGQYFNEGIHKVKITGVVHQDMGDKEYLEVGISGDGGETGEVRMYLTEKALKYTINTIRTIFVHNQSTEANKTAVRNAVNACRTTEEFAKLCQKLEGKECWYSKFKTGSTYQNAQGETKDSYSNNLFGYEPKPPKNVQTAQKAADTMGGGEITIEEFPFP